MRGGGEGRGGGAWEGGIFLDSKHSNAEVSFLNKNCGHIREV